MTHLQAVSSPAAWRAETLGNDWRVSLGARQREELRRAVDAARNDPRPTFELTRAQFALPTLGPRLEALP